MDKGKQLKSGLFTLVALVLLLETTEQSDFCNEPEKCDKWTLTSQKTHADAVVTYEQLKHMLSTGSVQLFDVRETNEHKSGFISAAANIPLGEIDQALRLNPDQFREWYGVPKPRTEDTDFVLYCQRGFRSLTALKTAWALGYTRARHYAGGYNEWIQREAQ
ncbi:hypothetical protein E1301_Tti016214 [Triplophysa tibetana]|uniref:Rhodanese domain-containing protein n=1 Tax=Triplophysa tibetana TaxID=1572043 RepID=A0A5A9P7Y0_9TELE|nr:hypothetical protein E1301_Tti016214 [Triplophysa tibetana]